MHHALLKRNEKQSKKNFNSTTGRIYISRESRKTQAQFGVPLPTKISGDNRKNAELTRERGLTKGLTKRFGDGPKIGAQEFTPLRPRPVAVRCDARYHPPHPLPTSLHRLPAPHIPPLTAAATPPSAA